MQRPIRVAQHFAGEQDDIGLVVADDLISLSRRGDHADSSSGDIGLTANPSGERRLIAGTDRNLSLLDIAARRAIDQIDPQGEEKARKLDRLVDIPTAFNPVGRLNPDKERIALGQDLAHRRHALAKEPRPILERAAIGVGTAIAQR